MKEKEQSKKRDGVRHWVALSAIVFLVSPPPAFSQLEFKVIPAVEARQEGGSVKVLIIQREKQTFELNIPKEYAAEISQSDQSILFTSQTGSAVITLKMTTNYPAALPKMETLRDLVAKKYAGASLVQTCPCYTAAGSGLLFDLFQPVGGDLMMRIRDGYIALDGGSVEFTLSCDLREYDKHRLSFAWLLNSFRLRVEPAIKNP